MTADSARPLAPGEYVAEMLALQADLHWQDAHPNTNASPAARLVAYLDHEAATCPGCHGTGRVAAVGTAHLPAGHPDTDDTACLTCDGA